MRVATEGHMDALALVDTFGVLAPHAMQYLVREAKKRVNKRLEAHFHMDYGMGIANTIMAVAEGVEVIHSTVLGLGERAGNVPMEETAMALLTLVWRRYRPQGRQALRTRAAGGRTFGTQGRQQPARRRRATVPYRVRHHRELVAELRQALVRPSCSPIIGM